MFMMKCFLPLCLVLILGSCAKPFDSTDLLGSWKLTEVILAASPKAKFDKDLWKSYDKRMRSDGYVLSIFADNTYTELRGYEVENGIWEMSGNKELKLGQHILKIGKIEEVEKKTYLTGELLIPKDGSKLTLKWVKETQPLTDYKQDPLHGSNNLWRKKPSRKESPSEIKARLLNHLQHTAYILGASLERKTKNVSFSNSMGIVKIYKSAIGAITWDKVEQDWIDCFYDPQDAELAYQMFVGYLSKSRNGGGSTGSWVKDDYEILMALCEDIKHGK